jgi:hypothetical protein
VLLLPLLLLLLMHCLSLQQNLSLLLQLSPVRLPLLYRCLQQLT